MTSAQNLTWVLEAEVFDDRHEGLQAAARAAGQDVLAWDDIWWSNGAWPRLFDQSVVFHGSLGNADRVRRSLPWRPGAFCNTEAFRCSSWYRQLPDGLLNRRHAFTTVRQFCDDPESHFEALACADAVFVRPDSALKPFSGRLLTRGEVSPKALDHGFYYDELDLPIVLAPPRTVEQEWRLVVVDGVPVAGSAYDAEGRCGRSTGVPSEVFLFAENAGKRIAVGDRVYVIDICLTNDGLSVLELNPFSGADLYLCDRDRVVEALGKILVRKPNA
ncbi:MAG: ATP-grasp domain-containing protein [Kiloniellales bacterium]|nr:ATP-grasp domain-containing protein [Kiloniellales bacterium]